MPDLFHTLIKYDLGQLKIIADLWGIELESRNVESAVEELCISLLDPNNVRETIEVLPAEARSALTSLLESNGRTEWAVFSREFGTLREMGAGKRDREKPYLDPGSPAEVLYYHGLMARAFFDSGRGAQEFAYIPDDLLSPIQDRGDVRLSTSAINEPLGRAATPVEKSFDFPASDRLLDDATTLLAALRTGKEDLKPDPRLPPLLTSARILRKNIPQAEAVKKFLEATRQEALDMLQKAWLESQIFNELRLIPGLICEGEWTNDPLSTRRRLLDLIEVLPKEKWWSMSAFLRDLKTRLPDFQRPAGDYDSWFIRRGSDGQYLRGFAYWDQVDGALVTFLIQTLHWLGKADLASKEDGGPFTSFRLSSPSEKSTEKGRLGVASNGRITVARTFSRALRYQIARFCDWEEERKDGFVYSVSAQSLMLAGRQGLKAEQLLAVLVKHTNSNVPPAMVKALKRWESNRVEAKVERLVVLRVTRPEVLEEMRKSKAGKFLGEILSPTAVVIKEGAIQKVLAALAELGLFAEMENEG